MTEHSRKLPLIEMRPKWIGVLTEDSRHRGPIQISFDDARGLGAYIAGLEAALAQPAPLSALVRDLQDAAWRWEKGEVNFDVSHLMREAATALAQQEPPCNNPLRSEITCADLVRDNDNLRAALAQQAQPLTDEMIVAEAKRRGIPAAPSDYARVDAISLARWARDRMAQPAQPLPKCPNCTADTELILHCPNCGINGPKYEQAQPEMPTREMIQEAIESSCGELRGPVLVVASQVAAERVLALFAPKGRLINDDDHTERDSRDDGRCGAIVNLAEVDAGLPALICNRPDSHDGRHGYSATFD